MPERCEREPTNHDSCELQRTIAHLLQLAGSKLPDTAFSFRSFNLEQEFVSAGFIEAERSRKTRKTFRFPTEGGVLEVIRDCEQLDSSNTRILESLAHALSSLTSGADSQSIGVGSTVAEDRSERGGQYRFKTLLLAPEGDKHYRDLFEHATDILYTHDLLGRITLFNQTAERLTGCSRQVAQTKGIRDLVAPDHHDTIAQAMQRLLGGEPVTKYRVEILTASGKRCPVEISSRLMFERGRPVGVQSAGRDLRERQRLESQLLHAHKMEAIGRLAGGVAHDFNNLLTVISGYTQWILDELGEQHPLWEAAHESLLASDRARRLTNQLLAFSRMQVVKPEIVDLNTIVAPIERMLRRVIGEDVDLQISMSPHLWLVSADSGQIEQILLNLCVNSRDAMPNGGTIRIETGNLHVTAGQSGVLDIPTGEYVALKVADNGSGMDEDTRTRVFEPFFTTKEIGKGTGLGLSTVYGIVRQSNGHITVESVLTEGTTITVLLPRDTAACSGTPALPAINLSRGSERVLLVEDEAAVRKIVREMLVRLGYSVTEAADGKSAYQILQDNCAPVDILLTDVVMPGMGGRELAEMARALHPGLRVLYISGYTDDALLRDRPDIPGVSLLSKPFTPQALARKIREVLDSPLSQ